MYLPPRNSVTFSQLFLPPSISAAFPGDARERRIFHRFQVCTVPVLTGGSESGFWESLVLKAGQKESVVRNAIIALGTLHEDYQNREGRFSNHLIREPSHQQALQLYGKALRQLNNQLHAGSAEGAKLAIISSILFTCFEVLRRNNMAAVIHYQAGMRELIRQLNMARANDMTSQNFASPPPFNPIPQGELDELLRVFARYDIQACTFSKPTTERLDCDLPRVPPTSLTLDQVKIHLDNLLISVYQLVKSNRGMYRYWSQDEVPAEWVLRKKEVTCCFEAWLDALENFVIANHDQLRPTEVKSLLGLRLQIRVAICMLKNCIDCGPETSFDKFEEEFELIVAQVESMSNFLGLREGLPLETESTAFTMELGVIHPLFFVAMWCRNWTLRRRAIKELKRAGREGVWEGPVMAVLAERLVQIEENELPVGTFIPESNRLHRIDQNVDYETRKIYFEATRAKDRTWKDWEVIREAISF